jgi:hypothetical protein
MSTVDDTTGAEASTAGRHPALDDLFRYPLLSALTERRTRRIPRGFSVNAGPLSHESHNEPAPLTKLEEAILVLSIAGITGTTQHDGPLVKPDGTSELGTPFLNIMARMGSSADNAQATYFFMINDDGIFLVRHPVGPAALEMGRDLPPKWSQWTDADWIEAAERCLVRVSDKRLSFPREWPYYLGWNAQASNAPGTTLFFPVVDCTWQYINALIILASEPDGKRPLFVDDWSRFKPKGLVERLAKLGGAVGLTEKIPYHPIGGLTHIRSGFVNKDSIVPLGFAHGARTDYEAFFYFQNLMLLGQGMGLGGWIHGAVFAPYIWQQDEAKGWHGLGFRMDEAKVGRHWPPVPASQANPVGIDGILESLSPPYVSSMDEAVDRVVESKYRTGGAGYGNEDIFARSYRNRDDARAYLATGSRFDPRQIAYIKDVCNYIYDTYDRFPAHVDAFYAPGMWLQFSHLETEYYDRYFDPAQYTRQAAHDALWHP